MGIRAKEQRGGTHVAARRRNATAAQAAKKARRMPLAAKVILVLLGLLLAGLCVFTYAYPSVFPGVTVGTIPVGGMTEQAAADRIMEQSGALYEDAKVSLTIYQTTYDIPVRDVLESVDGAQSAANAFAVGRTGNPLKRMWDVATALVGLNEAQIAAQVDDDGLEQALEDIVAEALTGPVEPTWEVGTDCIIIHAGKPGVNFDTKAVRELMDEKIRLMDFEPYEVSTELSDIPAIDIDKIAAEAIGEGTGATVDKTDGTTIIPEKPGVQFDIEEARAIIGDGSAESYTIPATITPAKVTAEQLAEVLFRDTLAQTSTSLDEGNVARTNNVRLASASINGTILNPGDEFSYNTVVGERTEARGYKPAGAYVNGQVVDEFGGGVCQPSSTLYMAVLRADLEVTERHNHSFTVAYTPLGEDATVDYGNLDFRFKNNTDYPVKIVAEQTNGQMIMTILGTKTTDKTVETRTDVLATYSPETVEKTDASMKPGESRVETTGITGYSTRTYKIITENGETTEELANSSNYVKRDKVVYVGAAQTTTTTPDTSTGTETGGDAAAGGTSGDGTAAGDTETGGTADAAAQS